MSTTLEQAIVDQIVERCAPGAGRATVDATESLVESAPAVNDQGRVLKLLSLANHMRSRLCASALDAAGDSDRAQLLRLDAIIDADTAFVAAENLKTYRVAIDDLPNTQQPGIAGARSGAKAILDETVMVLAMLSELRPIAEVGEDEELTAAGCAARAVSDAYKSGIVMGLPDATRAMLLSLQTAVFKSPL